MKLGSEDKKKVYALAGLGVFAAYMVYANLLSGPSVPSAPADRSANRGAATAPSIPVASEERTPASPRHTSGNRSRSEEFHPVLHAKRPEDRPDPTVVDPTLHLELLAKVQAVELAGGSRNLFQFGAAPPKAVELAAMKWPEPVVHVPIGPRQPPPPPPPPGPPPPTPIPYKFYGYATVKDNGKKTAYFLDGDDILAAAEGEMLKRRYRVIRISPNSVLLEDTESKRQQSLPLTVDPQAMGG